MRNIKTTIKLPLILLKSSTLNVQSRWKFLNPECLKTNACQPSSVNILKKFRSVDTDSSCRRIDDDWCCKSSCLVNQRCLQPSYWGCSKQTLHISWIAGYLACNICFCYNTISWKKAANLSVKHRMYWPVIEWTGTVRLKRNQVEIKLHHMAQPTF